MTVEIRSVPVAVPLEPTTPIKPSEALRLGRLTHPKRPPALRDYVESNGCACAVGAIALGYGWRSRDEDGSAQDFAAARIGVSLMDEIESRYEGWNDRPAPKWSDKRLVKWLEGLGL